MASSDKVFTITGTEELARALEAWGRNAALALSQALYEEAENLMTRSKRLVPVDTGNLRASGHVRPPVRQGGALVVVLGYGGPAGSGNQGATNSREVGYAVYVHENTQAQHTTGQAKFLEQPVLEAQRTLGRTLAERGAKVLRERGLA